MLVRLISMLADGQFHSGQELGEILGISRAAVWKHIKKLDELEIPYSSVKGKGYRLHEKIEVLDSEVILSHLDKRIDRLDVLLDVESTNAFLFHRAREYMGQKYAVFAEKQTKGKGRRGRQWVSPFGKNIYCSLLVSFQGGVSQLEGLSLVVGIAVQRALVQLGIEGVGLKWPNDIYLGGEKLAGILLEVTGEYNSHCQVVIGVGINVSLNEQDAQHIDQPWTSLTAHKADISRNEVAGVCLREMMAAIEEFQQNGFAAFQEQWTNYDIYNGRQVSILTRPDSEIPACHGTVKGVNRKGELLLQTDRGIQTISAGEISVRPVN